MFSPTYDYIHAINGLKGWPMWQPIDTVGVVAASDAAYAVEGRVGHFTANGSYAYPEIALGASGVQAPMILHRSASSYDVVNGATAASGAPQAGQTMGTYGWVAGIPTGTIGAVSCYHPCEIETTEFDATDTFAPNMPLKSPTVAQAAANAGLLYGHRNWAGGDSGAVTIGTDTVVGIVSRGGGASGALSEQNNYKVSVIAFWPHPIYGTV